MSSSSSKLDLCSCLRYLTGLQNISTFAQQTPAISAKFESPSSPMPCHGRDNLHSSRLLQAPSNNSRTGAATASLSNKKNHKKTLPIWKARGLPSFVWALSALIPLFGKVTWGQFHLDFYRQEKGVGYAWTLRGEFLISQNLNRSVVICKMVDPPAMHCCQGDVFDFVPHQTFSAFKPRESPCLKTWWRTRHGRKDQTAGQEENNTLPWIQVLHSLTFCGICRREIGCKKGCLILWACSWKSASSESTRPWKKRDFQGSKLGERSCGADW